MHKESKAFLKELLNTNSPSGFEEQVQKIWCERIYPYVDTIERDVMGNSVASLNKQGKFKVMLDGHCDEIGFIITYISDEGFLYIEAIGGIDRSVMAGTHVTIQTSKGNLKGIIGKKAIHLETNEERGKSLKINKAYIDVGFKNKKEASKQVQVGDSVSFSANFIDLSNNLFSSKGCDNKVGIYVVSEVLKELSLNKDNLHKDIAVFGSSSVQEEVGLRGATTSAYTINPDVAFVMDVTFSSDTPDASKAELGEVSLGKGGAIHPGPGTNRLLYNLVRKVAKGKKIPYQIQSSGYPSGTDTSAIQLSRRGAATVLISIPNRYMHTQVETCSYDDLDSIVTLIVESILKLKPNMSFIPKLY